MGLANFHVMTYGWTGARDLNQDNTFVFIGSGTVLPDSSGYWHTPGWPSHGNGDCVHSSGDYHNGKLTNGNCNLPRDGYICEKY